MAFTTSYFALDYSAKNTVVILGTVDQMESDTPFTHLIAYVPAQNAWGTQHLEGIRATSVCCMPDGVWVTGDRGQAWLLQGGKIARQEQLPDSGLEGRCLGQPNDIHLIAGWPHICGFAGQVYRLVDRMWLHMDDGLAEPEGAPDSEIDLESIDGTGPNNIYTVGSGGLVAHWDGRSWTRLPVPTNVYLSRVRCFAPDHIVVVGNKGVVLESDGKNWRSSRIPGGDDTGLADVVLFQGRVYVAAQQRLFRQKGASWEEVRHGLPKDKTEFLRLTVGGDRLWAMGYKRLNSFDGSKWTAHPDPNNK